MSLSQTIIIPYHRNGAMLKYTTSQLEKIIDSDVEIIVVGNNSNTRELDIEISPRIKYIKIEDSLLYSKTANLGVSIAKGDIITLCDQDVFSYSNWYYPLLKKLEANRKIGSVSSKLLSPATNRIIDFGIEYSDQRIVHTLRGHMYNHPLAMLDRKVTSTTSATFMTYKSLYQQVGGMDLDMPYCCSDCDIGIKISLEGYENWVVADSVAYHKGSSSNINGKKQSFDYLKEDSHIMFWLKNKHRLTATVEKDLKVSIDYIRKNLKTLYTFINLSSSPEYKWYSAVFSEYAKADISDIFSYRHNQGIYHDSLQIYDCVPYFFINYSTPLIYFVDYFPALKDNVIWMKMRGEKNDIIMDIAGNIVLFDDLITGKC